MKFHFQATKDGRVLISADGRVVKTLRGKEALKFLDQVERGDPQLVMAKATGQFKFGNEKPVDRKSD